MKINRKLIETLTKEVILESQLEKKVVVKKKKELNESEMLNETPLMDFINAVKDLDPAALTALAASSLPLTAAISTIVDVVKKDPKDPSKGLLDRLRDAGTKVAQNR
jgi:hypothetical protein